MDRKGSAIWEGGLKNGKGTVSTESTVLNKTPYSFHSRLEEGKDTNPEELIAAAHAGCFSMALSGQLENLGVQAKEIKTTATVTLQKDEKGFSIPRIHLHVKATIPNSNQETFEKAAKNAKEGCPVSKLMRAEITMDTEFVVIK
ncbi:organic hydroperoxide resistance protein (plasmid) [Legionella adelaidensis]|uniref:Organic hydroperoxide resistance protein n=1 Tax=Legionella adelaidensis TaxID=45056 RepID=A0A0W0R5J6_9GAMM|nr:OsmC family protein [Legionella adelaidensis]KTC66306.1 organic hydroperoxide resistance protein [Legionella adelaidensis]VEH84902.1 organic hydroperoxide resistance protein [Legionella adelaidensis]